MELYKSLSINMYNEVDCLRDLSIPNCLHTTNASVKYKKIVEKDTAKIKKKSRIRGTTTREDTIKIDTPAAVNKLLTQRSSHKYIVSSTGQDGGGVVNRQSKQAEFLKKVRQTADEERANRLRWSVLYETQTHLTPYPLLLLYEYH